MDKDPKTVTGEIIAEARRKKGYTQEALAEALGVTRQAVSRWESGSAYPETENLVRLAKLLDLDLNYLLKGEQSETPSETHCRYRAGKTRKARNAASTTAENSAAGTDLNEDFPMLFTLKYTERREKI